MYAIVNQHDIGKLNAFTIVATQQCSFNIRDSYQLTGTQAKFFFIGRFITKSERILNSGMQEETDLVEL